MLTSLLYFQCQYFFVVYVLFCACLCKGRDGQSVTFCLAQGKMVVCYENGCFKIYLI